MDVETISVLQFGTIVDLRTVSATSFGQGFLRLAADGCLFNPTDSLQLSGLRHGDNIAVAQQPKLL